MPHYSRFAIPLHKKSSDEFYDEIERRYLPDDVMVAINTTQNIGIIISKTPEVDTFLRLLMFDTPGVEILDLTKPIPDRPRQY